MTTATHSPELNSGIWTTWLPITAAYPSQSGCRSAAWARFGIQDSSNFWPYIYDPAYDASVANSVTCLPPAATSWWDGPTTVDGSITKYSLGPVTCPVAYETVSTILITGGGGQSTSVICCPTSFQFVRSLSANGGIDGVCTSAMTAGHVFTYASPASNSYVSATTTLQDALPLIAVPIEGYNFAAVTTSSSSSSTSSTNLPASTASSPTSSPTSSGTATGSGASPTNTSAASSGLSSGAKAGIGVGVAALALGLLAIAGFFFWRRRSSRRDAYPPPSELAGNWDSKEGNLVPVSNEVHEMIGASRPAELPGRDV